MRFFTSDTHFGHARIIELCNRPFDDISHMDEMLIANWNDVVSPEDEVFHLGDVALGPWERWHNILTRLNGFKILVVGNHDRIFKGNKDRLIERFVPHYAEWFDVIADEVTNLDIRDVNGQVAGYVNLSHFPYDGDSHGNDRYTDFRLADRGLPLVHGHTHSSGHPESFSSLGTPQFHVGVDAHGYKPVSELEVASWLRSL